MPSLQLYPCPVTQHLGHTLWFAVLLRERLNFDPSLPRYQEIWDVSIVLKYLTTLHPAKELNLKNLTLKVTMLMALLTGQRCQTLQALSVKDMMLTAERCLFQLTSLLKTSRPGKHLGPVVFTSFTPDENLCVVSCLTEYIARAEKFRDKSHKLLKS